MIIRPIERDFAVTLTLPGSKSMSNRALILSSLCDPKPKLIGLLECDDTATCKTALAHMNTTRKIDCHDAGTVARFLVPLCAGLGGEYIIDGSLRMRDRPILEMIRFLQQQGVRIEWLERSERMPFKMISTGLIGGEVCVNVRDSSQFLSGMLLVAPLTKHGLTLKSSLPIATQPYVQMTLQMMQSFGVVVKHLADDTLHIVPSTYKACEYIIEPDASTASYFFAAAALNHSKVTVMGLNSQSLQGDLRFLEVLEIMGCSVQKDAHKISVVGPSVLKGVGDVDMEGITDTFMTLACMAPFLPTKTIMRGLHHARLQESDRVVAVVDGLTRLGIHTEFTADTLTVYPGVPKPAYIDSYNDHRIVMSFATLGLKSPGVIITGADCVSKTCPSFFTLMESLYGQ